MTTTRRHLALGFALMTALTTPVLTQNLAADLQRAEQREALSGDCKSVLPEYTRIAAQGAKSSRPVAAEALLRIGMCHEREGRAQDAKAVFLRVTSEFANVQAIAAQASAKASAMPDGRGASASQREMPFRALAPDAFGDVASMVSVSPDGKWITKTSPEKGFTLRNVASGSEQAVTGLPPWRNSAAGPVWSPDSAWVAFWSFDGNSATAIRAVNIANQKLVTVAEWPAGSAGPRLAWSRDSGLIAYVRGRTREGAGACTPMPSNADSCVRDLQVADVTGTKPPVSIWIGDDVPSMSWSPTGRALAFVALKRVEKTVDLYVANPGDGSHRILAAAMPVGGNLLTWTRDDHLWLYRRSAEYLRVSVSDGTVSRVLEPSDGWVGAAPDGSSVVVRKNSGRLAIRSTSDGTERPLTTGTGREMQAMLSPDGRLVFFASNRDGRWAYYVSPVDTAPVSNPVQLARLDGVPTDSPTTVYGHWSAQGGVIIANSPYREYYISRAGINVADRRLTGSPERLTVTWSETYAPTVSPDGSLVALSVVANGRQAIAVMAPNGDRDRIVLEHDRVKLRWRGVEELLFSEGAGAPSQLAKSFWTVNIKSGVTGRPAFAELPVDLDRERLLDWDYLPGSDEIFFVTGTPAPAGLGYVAPYRFQRFSLRDGSHHVIATREQFDYPNGTVKVSRDGRFAAFTARGALQIMSMDDPVRDRPLPAGPGYLSSLAWSEDGRDLLACNLGGRCLIIAVDTGQSVILGNSPVPDAETRWLDAQWLPGGLSILLNQGAVRQVWFSSNSVTLEAVNRLIRRP